MLRLPKFEYFAPQSLEEGIALLTKENGQAKVVAGGTDLLVKMKKREIKCPKLVGLKNISGLDFVQENGNMIRLGPLVTHDAAANSDLLKKYTPFLAKTCRELGSYQVQCMGTIGGNICNASPSADSVVPLLVLEPQVRILSRAGERLVSLDQFFMGPFETVLGNDEILTSIQIPKPAAGSRGVYLKLPKVTEKDETLVGVAMVLMSDPSRGTIEEIRIGLGSMAPTPIRAKKTEDYLRGKDLEDPVSLSHAEELLMSEVFPRSRGEYRRQVAKYLFRQGLEILGNEASEKRE